MILNWLEIRIFHYINRDIHNPVFDAIMPILSELGSGWFVFVLTMAILIIFRKDEKMRRLSVLLFAGLTLTYYTVSLLKYWFSRPRPFEAMSGVCVLAGADTASFPSGHSAVIFMAAALLSNSLGKRFVFYTIACLVAFSRIYLGVHYLSDVIAGSVIGALAGYWLIKVSEKKKRH